MQQTPQMIPMMPSFPQQTNITTEQIQKVCFFFTVSIPIFQFDDKKIKTLFFNCKLYRFLFQVFVGFYCSSLHWNDLDIGKLWLLNRR